MHLMEPIVLQMCFDGSQEELTDGHFEYSDGRNRDFFVPKNCMFDVFFARGYKVLETNSNDYSITLKTTLQLRCYTQLVYALHMNVHDDKMVEFYYI